MLQIEAIGNLGNDAEIKEFSGKRYVSFNVAHSERKKCAGGVVHETTTWVSVLWYGDGGGLTPFLKKGCKVFVRGRLVPKTYLDRNNQPQVGLNVYASEVNLCGTKAESTGGNTADDGNAAESVTNKNALPF